MNRCFSRDPGTIFARGFAGTHHRLTHFGHYGAHIGEIHVDHTGTDNQVGNPLHGTQQHIVGRLESLQQTGGFTEHLQQFLIGHCDQ